MSRSSRPLDICLKLSDDWKTMKAFTAADADIENKSWLYPSHLLCLWHRQIVNISDLISSWYNFIEGRLNIYGYSLHDYMWWIYKKGKAIWMLLLLLFYSSAHSTKISWYLRLLFFCFCNGTFYFVLFCPFISIGCVFGRRCLHLFPFPDSSDSILCLE